MKIDSIALAALLLFGVVTHATAFAPDGCEQQRQQYPADWNDTKNEKELYECREPQAGAFRIKVGITGTGGRTLMSLVPTSWSDGVEDSSDVLRIWQDAEQISTAIPSSSWTMLDHPPITQTRPGSSTTRRRASVSMAATIMIASR